MTSASCPSPEVLRAFVEVRLDRLAEEGVQTHLSDCVDCRLQTRELEPSLLFAGLPPRTLPEVEWDQVMHAVRESVQANPRRQWRSVVAGWFQPRWLVPVGASLAMVALVALQVGHQGGVDPKSQMAKPVQVADAIHAATDGGFVYLSNPTAEITHMSFAGAEFDSPVVVTMVVDETLADIF